MTVLTVFRPAISFCVVVVTAGGRYDPFSFVMPVRFCVSRIPVMTFLVGYSIGDRYPPADVTLLTCTGIVRCTMLVTCVLGVAVVTLEGGHCPSR